ncbi:MAG: class II aldolase/adducin family protein [Burkholderiales bacterium]|nr:class II aldolase/adducin family protein [Burkholderiales bacterium]
MKPDPHPGATPIDELVTANRILAREGVIDSFGHVSMRDPADPRRFLLSRSRAPQQVEPRDIMRFALDGSVVGDDAAKPYAERFIHAAIYERRPEVLSVVHTHSPSVVPFTVVSRRMRPIMHMCAPIGSDIPCWDIRHRFGDTNLLVTRLEIGHDLADALGERNVALMRGHGCVVTGRSLREAVFTAVYMEVNAAMLTQALALAEGPEDIVYLSEGEIEAISKGRSSFGIDRAWENWCLRANRPFFAQV